MRHRQSALSDLHVYEIQISGGHHHQWEGATGSKTGWSSQQQCVGLSEKPTCWLDLSLAQLDQWEAGISVSKSTGAERKHRHDISTRVGEQMCYILRKCSLSMPVCLWIWMLFVQSRRTCTVKLCKYVDVIVWLWGLLIKEYELTEWLWSMK